MSPTITSSSGAILVRGLDGRTSTRTRYPCARAAFEMAEPTKPLAPVTSRRSPGFDSAIEFARAFINRPERSPAGGVALHPARVGCGAAAAALAGGGGETALTPVGVDLDDVAAAFELLHRRRRQAALGHQHARPRGARPERDREMLGVPGRGVDRLLQIHAGMNVAHEQLRRPLILLVAAGRAPGEIRLPRRAARAWATASCAAACRERARRD